MRRPCCQVGAGSLCGGWRMCGGSRVPAGGDLRRTVDMTIDPGVAWLIIACAGLLFLVAALHKLRDLRRFREVFAAYQLMPVAAGRLLAPGLPALESAVSVGLLFENMRAMALWIVMALLLSYATA